MKFKVKFTTPEYGDTFSFPSHSCGLEVLDLARQHYGENIDVSLVDGFTQNCKFDVQLLLNEEEARESGLFQKCGDIVVTMKRESLNRFGFMDLKAYRDDSTQAITRISVLYKCDEAALFAAWKEAGFPTKWDLNAEGVEDLDF